MANNKCKCTSEMVIEFCNEKFKRMTNTEIIRQIDMISYILNSLEIGNDFILIDEFIELKDIARDNCVERVRNLTL